MNRTRRMILLSARRTLCGAAGTALLVILTPGGLPAQSLPEIARQIRDERANAPAATRVFTTESIRTDGRRLAAASRTIAAPPRSTPEPAPSTEGPDAETTEAPGPGELVGGRTEAEWRQAFADAREEIERAEDRRTLAEQELQTLDRRLLTESSLYNREAQLGPMINAKREEIAAAEERVQQAIDTLAALQTELRTAGGPAGWAR